MLSKEILQKVISPQIIPSDVHGPFQDIHWKYQESSAEDILFIWLDNNQNHEKILNEISIAKYAILISNDIRLSKMERSLIVSENEYYKMREEICNNFYPKNGNYKVVGVTGTNGKSTTVHLIGEIAMQNSLNVLTIGTLGIKYNQKIVEDFSLTTPSFIDYRKIINKYGESIDILALEMSSHALFQKRLGDIRLDAAAWLSFSQDHLDFHQSLEKYFESKLQIVSHLKESALLYVPKDQNELQDLLRENKIIITPCSNKIKSELIGFKMTFNLENLNVAYQIMLDLFKSIKVDTQKITLPSGRSFMVQKNNSIVVVDYAHTPDALKNIIMSVKKSFPSMKHKVLFGCGGNRDKSKRFLMGKIAHECSDYIYVTSDNPRYEDPSEIIMEILKAIPDRVESLDDREALLKKALGELGEYEVLIVAGKGHENYLDINGVKKYYSDIDLVTNWSLND